MRYRRCANRIALSSVQRSDFLLIGCDRSLARRSVRLSSRRSPQPKTAPDAEPTRARYVRAWQGPIPHQFLLNDIESILPGPLEAGAGCDPTCFAYHLGSGVGHGTENRGLAKLSYRVETDQHWHLVMTPRPAPIHGNRK